MKGILFAAAGALSAVVVSLPLCIRKHKKSGKLGAVPILNYGVFVAVNALLWFACSFTENNVVCGCASACLLTLLLLAASFDIRTKLVPPVLLILSGVAGVLVVLSDSVLPWQYHLIGGGASFLIFLFIRFVATKVEKQEALGMADVVLATAVALALGVWKMLPAFLMTFLLGTMVVLVCKIVKKYDRSHEYAFTPMLAAGYTVALLFGDAIINGYLDLLGIVL